MTGQVNKKRDVFLNGKWIKVDSKRITINTTRGNVPEVKGGKFKLNDVWYIFDLESGSIVSQGNNWTDCLNKAKSIVNTLFNPSPHTRS